MITLGENISKKIVKEIAFWSVMIKWQSLSRKKNCTRIFLVWHKGLWRTWKRTWTYNFQSCRYILTLKCDFFSDFVSTICIYLTPRSLSSKTFLHKLKKDYSKEIFNSYFFSGQKCSPIHTNSHIWWPLYDINGCRSFTTGNCRWNPTTNHRRSQYFWDPPKLYPLYYV